MPDFNAIFIVLAATVFLAGVARGLSGFGTGMIVAPVAAALYGPQAALVVIVVMDSLPTVPVTIPAMKIARWSEVLPILAGLAFLLPAGIWMLKHGDPYALRWGISIVILLLVAGLWKGWRYRGPRNFGVSFGVGGVAGVLSGIASIPGPPVIMYWLASGLPAAMVRANLLSLFLLAEFLSVGNLWAAGMLERPRLLLALAASPFYFCGLLAGWRLYGFASDDAYRRITFMLILASAILALPPARHVFDFMARLAAG